MPTLPEVPLPPGQASLYSSEQSTEIPDGGGTVTARDIEFNYSEHLDRIVTALEQLSVSTATIAENTTTIAENTTTITNAIVGHTSRQMITNFRGSISGNILTIVETSGEHVVPGMLLSGSQVITNTKITKQLTGSGKEGTYLIDKEQNMSVQELVGTVVLNSEGIAYSLSELEKHQLRVKELSDGTGVHTVSPYDNFSLISIYKILVEQGKILDQTGNVDTVTQDAAISAISDYVNKFKLFREF